MSQKSLGEYLAALERLTRGRPTCVPKGTKITNDAVALEAGRGKGSIKKSRAVFASLIAAVTGAAAEQAKGANQQQNRLDKAKGAAEQYHGALEAALAREVSLLQELCSVKKQLAQLTGANVLPLRPPVRQPGAER